MVLVDGKDIAARIYKQTAEETALLKRQLKMAIITCAPNFETQRYLALKKRKAEEVGIALAIIEVSDTASTEEFVKTVTVAATQADGVVVQLPLPEHIDREVVLAAVPPEKDPDCFNTEAETKILPPVVAAIDEIANQYEIDFLNQKVVVLGHGRLVGAPAARYVKRKGATVSIVTEESLNAAADIKAADIIISGIGKSQYVSTEMVKTGVIIFDAGTSEVGGELRGDVDAAVAGKAAVFTPVPGGIGPITVAILLRNLVFLAKDNQKS